MAKGVALHAVRVLDCGGFGSYSGVIAGVDDGASVSYVEVDTCSHDKCSTGGPLTGGCDHMCVTDICAVDPYCCQVAWNSQCVAEVASICRQAC